MRCQAITYAWRASLHTAMCTRWLEGMAAAPAETPDETGKNSRDSGQHGGGPAWKGGGQVRDSGHYSVEKTSAAGISAGISLAAQVFRSGVPGGVGSTGSTFARDVSPEVCAPLYAHWQAHVCCMLTVSHVSSILFLKSDWLPGDSRLYG